MNAAMDVETSSADWMYVTGIGWPGTPVLVGRAGSLQPTVVYGGLTSSGTDAVYSRPDEVAESPVSAQRRWAAVTSSVAGACVVCTIPIDEWNPRNGNGRETTTTTQTEESAAVKNVAPDGRNESTVGVNAPSLAQAAAARLLRPLTLFAGGGGSTSASSSAATGSGGVYLLSETLAIAFSVGLHTDGARILQLGPDRAIASIVHEGETLRWVVSSASLGWAKARSSVVSSESRTRTLATRDAKRPRNDARDTTRPCDEGTWQEGCDEKPITPADWTWYYSTRPSSRSLVQLMQKAWSIGSLRSSATGEPVTEKQVDSWPVAVVIEGGFEVEAGHRAGVLSASDAESLWEHIVHVELPRVKSSTAGDRLRIVRTPDTITAGLLEKQQLSMHRGAFVGVRSSAVLVGASLFACQMQRHWRELIISLRGERTVVGGSSAAVDAATASMAGLGLISRDEFRAIEQATGHGADLIGWRSPR